MSQQMPRPAVRILQRYLAGANPEKVKYYSGKIDGLRGPQTHVAVKAALKSRAAEITGRDKATWDVTWSDKRRSIALYQLLSNDQAKLDPSKFTPAGEANGFWGPRCSKSERVSTG